MTSWTRKKADDEEYPEPESGTWWYAPYHHGPTEMEVDYEEPESTLIGVIHLPDGTEHEVHEEYTVVGFLAWLYT